MVEFTSGFQGALRVLLCVVWFTTVSSPLALAAEPGEVHSRVLNSLKFADEILGRRVVIVTELKRYEGSDSYAARAETTSPPFRQGASQDAATLRRDPDVLALELLEPYPVDDRSFLIKVLQTRVNNHTTRRYRYMKHRLPMQRDWVPLRCRGSRNACRFPGN